MTLSPEQKQAVARRVYAGDNLSAVQRKLTEEFGLSMTYMDVRFLVDDLDLALKDAAPKVDASDVTKAPAAPAPGEAAAAGGRKGLLDKMKEKIGLGADTAGDDEDEFPEADALPAGGTVRVQLDAATLIPGAVASGTVTFSDGVTGKWIVDQYGRPGFTEISKPGYRPSMEDSQAFMQELSFALQQRGY